ncbi:hypothetical protein [Salinilacihabitans rarus]|uniref:hypothetical protein n=1 Tax=Salinilacihabitans rarus TaxID=2961596 RepID=UPI0020C877FF|nr:hypothetical protein [Salinilacihabitans rarus]
MSRPRRDPAAGRRAFLAAAAAATAALAGCSEEQDVTHEEVPEPVEERQPLHHRLPDLPVPQYLETVEAGVEEGIAADVDDEESLREALEERDVAVEVLERDGRFLLVEHVADAPEAGVLEDVGVVAGAFLPYAVGSEDPGRLEATLLQADGSPFGSYDALVTWALSHDGSELPLGAYAELVAATLETEQEVPVEAES